jgi:osmotically-inducible protein OsmY
MKGVGRITAALGAAIAGVGAAVFFHPRSGGRNRHAAAGVARRRSANVATLVGRSSGRGGRTELHLVDDTLAAIVERHPGATSDLQITAHRGTVTLRGEVSRLDDIDALEATARSVPGVADVNNLLRLATTATATR